MRHESIKSDALFCNLSKVKTWKSSTFSSTNKSFFVIHSSIRHSIHPSFHPSVISSIHPSPAFKDTSSLSLSLSLSAFPKSTIGNFFSVFWCLPGSLLQPPGKWSFKLPTSKTSRTSQVPTIRSGMLAPKNRVQSVIVSFSLNLRLMRMLEYRWRWSEDEVISWALMVLRGF